MKKLIIILFACIANSCTAFHSSHSSHHSSHHASHHSSGHTSSHSYRVSHGTSHNVGSHRTSHPYTHVSNIRNSHINTTTRNNHFMYYYLLHNNHTNVKDTIFASNEYELQNAVSEVSGEPMTAWNITLFLWVVVGIVFVIIIYKIITTT